MVPPDISVKTCCCVDASLNTQLPIQIPLRCVVLSKFVYIMKMRAPPPPPKDVVTHPTLCEKLNGQGERASRSDDFTIIKLCSSPRTTCGLLELSFLAEKEKSNSSTHEMVHNFQQPVKILRDCHKLCGMIRLFSVCSSSLC